MIDFICDYIGGEPAASDETTEVIRAPKNEALDYVTNPAVLLRMRNAIAFDGRVHYWG